MANPAPSNLEAQLFGLSTLVQLGKRARHAATAQELAFIMVNESHTLIPYRQAALWQSESVGPGGVVAISGATIVERNVPFVLWLRRTVASLASATRELTPRRIEATDFAGALGAEWNEWLPSHGLWLPLGIDATRIFGGLFLAREQPWGDGEVHLLQELCDGYADAWAKFLERPHRFILARLWQRRGFIKLGATVAVVLALLMPVTLSALAPAEVVPLAPTIVRAPLDGVVDHFDVQPNALVTEGQKLLALDARAIQNKLDVATQALAVAQAEYQQAAQQAVFDDKSRAQLAILKGRMDQRRADVDYAKSLFDRVQVTAARGGIAVFQDPNDWIGRPVTTGERLLEIADPDKAELEIWLPVADAITLKPGAEIEFFLNIAPDAPVRAVLRQTSYEAALSSSGILGYRLKASLADSAHPPRIGLRGTAKLYGDRVTLFYYLMRRPLAATRQFLGL
jgi:hypothetical protein